MTPQRWARIKEVFGAASEMAVADRSTYLQSSCAGDPELRGEVEHLLSESERTTLQSPVQRFLDQPDLNLGLPGQMVRGYQILARLGAGGMGLVYRALDTRLGREVALKFLPADLGIDEAARSALVNEARAASALDHPNVGTIYGIEEASNGQPFIVMAYYEGETLRQKLDHGRLPTHEAVAIALQVANGLAEAHVHHIVHRDIKPSNIFLTRQGLIKILDFGIARVIHSAASTRSVHVAGTTAYMSPEQAQGRFLDGRSDLWSLGVVLFEMVAGTNPFAASDPAATLLAIVDAAPPELSDAVPRALQRIIYHALAKNPDDRYQSAGEMIRDLREISNSREQEDDATLTLEEIGNYRRRAASPTRPLQRSWKRRWLFGLPLLALVAGVLILPRHPMAPSKSAYDSYSKATEYLERYDKDDNLDRAVGLLKSSVKSDPDFALAYAYLGDAYRLKARLSGDQGLLREALSNTTRAIELNDSLPPVHVIMGRVENALGNRDIALAEFQRAQKLEPSNADALFGIAAIYEAQERLGEAEETYRRATALRPASWQGYNHLGAFLARRKRYDEAEKQFRRIIELTPDNAGAYMNLAATLIDGGKLAGAEAILQESLRHAPASYAAYANLGQLYQLEGRLHEATAATRRALELNDKDYRTWTNLAVIYRWLGKDEQSVAAYQRALPLAEDSAKISGQNAILEAQLAELYAYTGKPDQAVRWIEASLALAPANPSVLLSCADAWGALGDMSRAVALANRAVANGLTKDQLSRDPESRRFRKAPRFSAPAR